MGWIRDRMVGELELLRRRPSTIKAYVRCAANFVRHFMRSPTELDESAVRGFVLHLVRVKKIGPAGQKLYVAALRFLYERVLDLPEVTESLPWPRTAKTLPVILAGSEVAALLGAIRSPKYRAMALCAYGGGLRIGEICALRPEDEIGRAHV